MKINRFPPFFNALLTFHMIHGWGYSAAMWEYLAKTMPNSPLILSELGFLQDKSIGYNTACDVMITHSLGTLYGLKNAAAPQKGLVVINGFTNFMSFTTEDSLNLMHEGITRNAETTLRSFWRQCGIMPDYNADLLNHETLQNGLEWLKAWDVRSQLELLSCPVLILAGAKDKICPETMMRDHWQGFEIVIHPGGGHALPLTHPEWCAQQIEDWMKRNNE
jgi:pimeloyl-[acyl-carrier protein] methyl ester esterase